MAGKVPPVEGQGRLLWPFEKVENHQLSVYTIFDQMTRHFNEHKPNGNEEGEKYLRFLLTKIKIQNEILNDYRIVDQKEAQEVEEKNEVEKVDKDEEVEVEDDIFPKMTETYIQLIKKHTSEANMEAEIERMKMLNYIQVLEINIEYYKIQRKLQENTNNKTSKATKKAQRRIKCNGDRNREATERTKTVENN